MLWDAQRGWTGLTAVAPLHTRARFQIMLRGVHGNAGARAVACMVANWLQKSLVLLSFLAHGPSSWTGWATCTLAGQS